MKNKNIIGTKTIVIDPYIIFILINVWLHKLLKKFNMDVTVKMARFQIKQNVLNLKSTLESLFRKKCSIRFFSIQKIMEFKITKSVRWIMLQILWNFTVLYVDVKRWISSLFEIASNYFRENGSIIDPYGVATTAQLRKVYTFIQSKF